MNFAPAVAYRICLNLPERFLQLGTRLLAHPRTLLSTSNKSSLKAISKWDKKEQVSPTKVPSVTSLIHVGGGVEAPFGAPAAGQQHQPALPHAQEDPCSREININYREFNYQLID